MRAGLGTAVVGREVERWTVLGSTNDRARERAEAGAPEGLVVLAEEQTRGRGREGRPWHSPPGAGLWCSVLLRPALDPAQTAGLALLGAVAAARAVRRLHGLPAELKWPNDVLVGGLKLAGVLCEAAAGGCVVGIGLNVNLAREEFPPDLRATATSVRAELGRPADRLALLRGLLAEMDALYGEVVRTGGTAGLVAAWTALAARGEHARL